ncbi:TspO/MBR family protein [Methylobacterium organophilum]|uniref:TspO/MBR family protein n=1 Tax=Methylobacterium organophilum TaxID=410 RepID=UPI001EE19E38|nr:TspO/MBR family protein [Methylobacterium organophilum]UMY15817.1 tryptophan-rich sensory protein [Methylobacterium organophilum]
MTGLTQGGLGPPVVAALAALVVAVAGGLATVTDAWYRSLRVPDWKPPDWAFGPIWTVILALTAGAAVIAWNADDSFAARVVLVWAYAINGVLNIAWSVLFFRLRRPDWALTEVAFLWLSIAVLVLVTGRAAPAAGAMNLPYLLWVGIAACLNLRIVRLNPSLRGA